MFAQLLLLVAIIVALLATVSEAWGYGGWGYGGLGYGGFGYGGLFGGYGYGFGYPYYGGFGGWWGR